MFSVVERYNSPSSSSQKLIFLSRLGFTADPTCWPGLFGIVQFKNELSAFTKITVAFFN